MRVERLLSRPPAELWRALIEQTELGEQGPVLRLALPGGMSAIAARIVVYDSHNALECAWGGGTLRWQLQACDGMTRLIVTHTSAEPRGALADSRAWSAWIESL
jgi:hypothetical protein